MPDVPPTHRARCPLCARSSPDEARAATQRRRCAVGRPRQHRDQSSLQCPALDRPAAALLADLKSRGLLHDTLVIWGRRVWPNLPIRRARAAETTTRTPTRSGWPAAESAAAITTAPTDEFGYKAVEQKVHVNDLHATLLHLFGLDHERLTYRFNGRDFRLTGCRRQPHTRADCMNDAIPTGAAAYVEGLERRDVAQIASTVADAVAWSLPRRTLAKPNFLAFLDRALSCVSDWHYDHDARSTRRTAASPVALAGKAARTRRRCIGRQTGALRDRQKTVQIPEQFFFYNGGEGPAHRDSPRPDPRRRSVGHSRTAWRLMNAASPRREPRAAPRFSRNGLLALGSRRGLAALSH